MKDLLISHISDIDGISPVILMRLCKKEFDYELKEPHELEEYFDSLLEMDLSNYNHIYITDLPLTQTIYQKIETSIYKDKFKIFDHHKTHYYAANYNNVTINIEESGTTLFYQHLKKQYKFKKSVQEYVEHVKNLDLWKWVEKQDIIAKQLGDLLNIYGRNRYIEEMYHKLKRNKKFRLDKFENKILKLEQEKIDRYIEKKEKDMIVITYEGFKAGVIFSERYRSELGNKLSINHPELDFIIMMNLSGGISLRTEKDIDISVIAQKLNGGGHAKACGAPIPKEAKVEFIKNVFENCKIEEKEA